MTVAERPRCSWCEFGDCCGVTEGNPVEDCPVTTLDEMREPTNRDVMRLMQVLMTGVNQRFAQMMLILNQHTHEPKGRQ